MGGEGKKDIPEMDIRFYNAGRFGDPEKVAKAMLDADCDYVALAKGCFVAAEYGNFSTLKAWISATGGGGHFLDIAKSIETAAARGGDIVPGVRDLFSGLKTEAREDVMTRVVRNAVSHQMPQAFAAILSVLREDGDRSKPYLTALRDAVRLVSRDSPDSAAQVRILRTLHNEKVNLEEVGMASGNTELMHLGARFRMEDAEGEVARLRKQFAAATAENARLRATIADQPKQMDIARSRRYNMT